VVVASRYWFAGHTTFATAALSGNTVSGTPFCHCTISSSAPAAG